MNSTMTEAGMQADLIDDGALTAPLKTVDIIERCHALADRLESLAEQGVTVNDATIKQGVTEITIELVDFERLFAGQKAKVTRGDRCDWLRTPQDTGGVYFSTFRHYTPRGGDTEIVGGANQ